MEKINSTSPIRRGLGRVAFLARIETIKQALEQGWTQAAIYEKHKDALAITYSQFTRYVSKYITPPASILPVNSQQTLNKDNKEHLHASIQKEQRRFEYDAKPIEKEELI